MAIFMFYGVVSAWGTLMVSGLFQTVSGWLALSHLRRFPGEWSAARRMARGTGLASASNIGGAKFPSHSQALADTLQMSS
jgi:hypothetical protein